jgi:hypothetical protein
MKKVWIFDLETLNIFTATFIDRDSDEERVFVISNTRDDRNSLFNFLDNEVSGLVGYNSLHFDAQIIEYIYRNPNCTADDIRRYASLITDGEDRRPDVPEWKLRHKHLDLFRTLGLSVKAKRTGLKWCEYMMDFENIEDMPSQGEGNNWEEMVLSYNKNDVLATKELYKKYYHEVDLRKSTSEREEISLLNSTEPDMAKKLFGKYLSEAMKIPLNDLRSMQTTRDIVHIKDIIFPYVSFKTEAFNNVLEKFKKLSLKEYDSFEEVIKFQGIDIVYGLGGIHAAPNNKIFESNDKFVIKTKDVVSYYPNLMIRNNLCPEHLPKDIFLPLYEGFFNERRSIPKKDPRNYILKILLNATYGLTNDKFSFLRDRAVTLAICINGQLLLSMLLEELYLNIPDLQLIMMNTDGFEIYIPREYHEVYHEICKDWELLTKLELEFDEYSKMIISDCNNYISIFSNNKTKTKGKYEFENIPLHKNKSHSIIPRAVYNYWVNNIPVEQTIKNHTNIFDFCAGVKAKKSDKHGQSKFVLKKIDGENLKEKSLSKTVRYYICNKNHDGYLYKVYEDGSTEAVEAPARKGRIFKDWNVKYFNKAFFYEDMKDYNIDYSYYIMKANEWINVFNQKQLNLF